MWVCACAHRYKLLMTYEGLCVKKQSGMHACVSVCVYFAYVYVARAIARESNVQVQRVQPRWQRRQLARVRWAPSASSWLVSGATNYARISAQKKKKKKKKKKMSQRRKKESAHTHTQTHTCTCATCTCTCKCIQINSCVLCGSGQWSNGYGGCFYWVYVCMHALTCRIASRSESHWSSLLSTKRDNASRINELFTAMDEETSKVRQKRV